MNVVHYARVSLAMQDADDKVSIDQQLAEMEALCERNSWRVVSVLVDKENYRATQSPKKGKIVNPSGERADRPRFLEMLERIKTGEVDAVLCWRDDRLVRHPRVAVALEDALDLGDAARAGKDKIQILDATGAKIDRFTLSIKATLWREENKRRAERSRMGKLATLQQGRWPGQYQRYGYVSRRENGKRGRVIEIVESEVRWVRKICTMFDAGKSVRDIRRYLIAEGAEQKGHQERKHEWAQVIIYNILRAEDYTGQATWKFKDETNISVEIPPIIDRDLWERNQKRIERNRYLSTRNAGGVYLLQGIGYCGDCGKRLYIRSRRTYQARNGKRVPYKNPPHEYYCWSANRFRDEPHPQPYTYYGSTLDWTVWRHIVDSGIKRPDLMHQQVLLRQAELRAQGESADGDIAHARRRLAEVNEERVFYQRQAARGKITETEFDARMAETEQARQYSQTELERLSELRDNAIKVQAGLDYATEVLTKLRANLAAIEQTPDELKKLSKDERIKVLKARQKIVRVLCDRVYAYSDGRVRIEGVLDGSEAAQCELSSPKTGSGWWSGGRRG